MVRDGWDAPVYIEQTHSTLQTQFCPRHARWWTLKYWARRYSIRLGKITQRYSSYGFCFKCGTTWEYVQNHVTYIEDGSGCFPMCEKCWRDTSPKDRLPYYRRLYDEWASYDIPDNPLKPWSVYENAVLTEGSEVEEVDDWPDVISVPDQR